MDIRPIDANALYEKAIGRMREGEVLHRISPNQIDAAPTLSLNTLRDEIYQDAEAHGLWEDEQNVQGWPVECAAAIECETDELYEAAREWEDSTVDDNEHFIEELADVIIICFSVAGKLGIDIDAAIRRKMEINHNRPWKHGKE